MHVLCAPSTDSPNSLPIFDDKQTILLSNNTVVSTYDFSVQQKHPDAQYLQMGNYIVFVDKYHKTKMYTLMSHDGDDLTHTWHAEDVGLDLLNESSEKWDYTGQPHDIAWYLDNLVLKDSGWTIGINEASILTRALKFDGETDTQLRRLGDIANQFDGAEVDFTIEMNGAQVTKQVVNIYKKVGSSVTQGRYIDSVNLKSLHSSGSIADLVTALKPFGTQMDMPEGQEGEAPRITIADVAYDDGRYYSPKGHPYLYDREARQQWSRFKAYNYANQGEFDGYIVGSYSYDTKDPNELLNRALTELKSRNKPSETYEANLLDINADIGDYVQIAHNQYNPPIYLSARVESVTNCYTANGQDTGVLGDYRKLESDIDPRIKEMLNALENQIKSHYMWIRYAEDDKGKGMTSVPTVGTKYIAILVNKPTAIPSDNPADYAGHWQLIQGQDGSDGIPGPKGEDGRTSYTHFAYANNVSGTEDFSTDDPTGRSYMGVYSDFTKVDSNNPSDYVWSYTKGETGSEGKDGAQGIPGKPGIDGKTPYTHVAYADNDEGGGFSQSPDNKAYMGWYSDFTQADSNDPSLYGWSLIKGADGKDGADGVAGKDGVGVKSTTVTYQASTSGTIAPTGAWVASPTAIAGQYQWTRTVWTYTDGTTEVGYSVGHIGADGATGKDGVAGKPGVGISSTTITYQASTSGTTAPTGTWVSSPPSVPGGNYLWTKTVWSYTDNTSETGYSVAKMGEKGDQGIKGPAGADGKSSYTHIAYANIKFLCKENQSFTLSKVSFVRYGSGSRWAYKEFQAGTYTAGNALWGGDPAQGDAKTVELVSEFSTSNYVDKTHIGVYVDFLEADSVDPSKYNWSLIKGATGANGAPGKPGEDGRTPYFHQAWADSKDGNVNFSTTDPTNRGYLGTYTDFTQADSTDPTKYFWVELVGALSIGGRNYFLNSDFSQAETNWNDANGIWFASGEKCNGQKVMTTTPTVAWMGGATNSFSQTMSTITNQQVTVSVWAKASKSGAKFHSEPNGGNGAFDTSLTNTWKRYSYVAQTNTNGTIFFMAVDVGTQYWISMPQVEIGNKVTDWSPAPEDTQEQIDTINQGLLDTNSKIAAVTKVDAQATAPTNPKNGDQWWVKDANGEINAFKIWDGTQWAPSTITQSLLIIKELDAVNINGSVINGSKFTNNFDYTDLNKINFKGVTEIANGSYKTDFKIAGSNQVGHVYVQPDGFHTYVSGRNGDVSTRQSIDLAFDAISLANGPTFGTLTAADIESTEREVWITSDGVNKPEVGFHKQFRQVWLDGLIALNAASAANPQFLFKLKNSKLYPKASRYISLISLRDTPNTAILRIDPDGSISNISCPVSNMRFVSEGIFYTIGD